MTPPPLPPQLEEKLFWAAMTTVSMKKEQLKQPKSLQGFAGSEWGAGGRGGVEIINESICTI